MYVAPKPPSPQGGLKNVKWPVLSKILTICDNFETVRDRMSVSIHTDFWLVTKSVTLNDFERRNSPYFAFSFTEFDSFAGSLRHSG